MQNKGNDSIAGRNKEDTSYVLTVCGNIRLSIETYLSEGGEHSNIHIHKHTHKHRGRVDNYMAQAKIHFLAELEHSLAVSSYLFLESNYIC